MEKELRKRSQVGTGEKKLPIIDKLNKKIYLYDSIDEYVAMEIAYVIDILDDFNPDKLKPITVYVNTPGGFTDSMVAILTSLDNTKSDVCIDITGTAYSAGAYIALCGDYIRISKFGHMMFHLQSWGYSGSRQDHENFMAAAIEHEDRIIKELLKRTKMSYKEFKTHIKSEDFYLSPNQALKYGFVDEVY